MADTTPIIIQAAELITTKPFEIIISYFKDKRDQKKALVQLLTDACFETQLEINALKNHEKITIERQREISKLWSKVCSELMIVYPQISNQFHAKAVSWAFANSWSNYEIVRAEENLLTIQKFIQKLAEK